jgi:hypothetical protein
MALTFPKEDTMSISHAPQFSPVASVNWNGAERQRPAVIVRAADQCDISVALLFARERALSLRGARG